MNYEEVKRKLTTLEKRANELNSEIIKRKTKYEMFEKQLKEEFGITPDQIDDTLKELAEQRNTEEKKLNESVEKVSAIVAKLEVSLNAD
jgi:5'-deoxynucleotidase YfbR-like HD superfamily hydrolase